LEKTHVDAAAMPPIVAFHGDADPLVPVAEDRRGVRALEKRGVHADLRIYPGLGHTIAPGLRDDLFEAMSRALPR
jgi:predicted esterase